MGRLQFKIVYFRFGQRRQRYLSRGTSQFTIELNPGASYSSSSAPARSVCPSLGIVLDVNWFSGSLWMGWKQGTMFTFPLSLCILQTTLPKHSDSANTILMDLKCICSRTLTGIKIDREVNVIPSGWFCTGVPGLCFHY